MKTQVIKLFNEQPLVAFATADKEGNPNVVPIYWKKVINENTIWFLDNFMRQTKQNLAENNKVCTSFWDPDTEDGYKLKGTAIYYSSGDLYDEAVKWMQSKKPGRVPRGVVVFIVNEVYTLEPGEKAGTLLK